VVSFEEFVEVSSPRLVRTARMLLGSSSDAEDLAQETLIRMHRHWSGFANQMRLRAMRSRRLSG